MWGMLNVFDFKKSARRSLGPPNLFFEVGLVCFGDSSLPTLSTIATLHFQHPVIGTKRRRSTIQPYVLIVFIINHSLLRKSIIIYVEAILVHLIIMV